MRAATLSLLTLLSLAVPLRAELLTDKERVSARKLNATKCAKCHKLYEPANYPEQNWAEWMVRMSRKSKLSREQADLLSRYFAGERRAASTGATNTPVQR